MTNWRRLVKCAVAAYLLKALNGGAKGGLVCISARRVADASLLTLPERSVARFLSHYFLKGSGTRYVAFARRRKLMVCIKRAEARILVSQLRKRCGHYYQYTPSRRRLKNKIE